MKSIIKYLVFSSLLIISCNEEEFLDKKPHTPTDYSFYTSEEGAKQGLNAAYDILQLGENVERQEFSGTVCSGDAMAGGEPGGNDQRMLQEIMKFNTITTNLYCDRYWLALYRGIYRCNLLITYLKEPIDGFDNELRNRIRGEALFLRGLFHFKLQITYGGFPQLQEIFNNELKGVPFVDHILSAEEWKQSRPELTYTWERIEQDFIDAAALLPLRSVMYAESSNIGRPTKGSAQAMLAKTYLYQEKWEQAYNMAKEVINSGEYHLEGEDGHEGPYIITRLAKEGEVNVQVPGYKWIWQPEANNCRESIFDYQHYMENTSVYPEGQEGNLVPQYYGPRAVLTWNKVLGANPPRDTLRPSELFWGFILPTKYFVETAFRDIGCEDNEGNILDPRFKLSVITPGDSVPFYYKNEVYRANYPDSVQVDSYYNNPATGNCTWKYFTDPYFDVQRASLGDRPQNLKYFRFADLLLIGAEAAANIGQNADALTWINRVRNRARNAGITGYPLDLTGIVTKEQVWAERRVELAFEGHQFYDIVRTKRAEKVLKTDALEYEYTVNPGATVQEQFGRNFVLGKNEIWPIPQSEYDATNGSISQNPQY
jgi:hypothetical protein